MKIEFDWLIERHVSLLPFVIVAWRPSKFIIGWLAWGVEITF